jgi:hypothetical protein
VCKEGGYLCMPSRTFTLAHQVRLPVRNGAAQYFGEGIPTVMGTFLLPVVSRLPAIAAAQHFGGRPLPSDLSTMDNEPVTTDCHRPAVKL